MKTAPCPKCGAILTEAGEVVSDGQSFPVFQCDDCIVPVKIGGETFDSSLTFALRPDGTTFDPSANDFNDS